MLTIVFDLDGTLIDTAPDLIDTLNHTLAQQGLPVIPFETARPLIGGGAKGMIEKALATEGRDCAPADIDRLYAAFVAHYAVHIADRSRPFPKLEATLDRLAEEGHRLARRHGDSKHDDPRGQHDHAHEREVVHRFPANDESERDRRDHGADHFGQVEQPDVQRAVARLKHAHGQRGC